MKVSKILFVEPPRNYWFVMGEYLPPPTSLLILAAYIERELPDIEIEVLDCQGEQISWDGLEKSIESYDPSIVITSGFTCNAYTCARTAEIAKTVDEGIVTIVGGIHFSSVPEESLIDFPEIDYIVRGEGELTIVELVKTLRSRKNVRQVKGISYQHKALRTEANLTWYFNEDADLGLATNPDLEDRIDDGFELGIAFEWAFNPAFKASVGYLYSYTGVDPLDMKPENPELDVHSIGGGIAWQAISDLDLNLSIGNAFYQNDSFVDNMTGAGTVEYEKNIFFIAFGIQYRFF